MDASVVESLMQANRDAASAAEDRRTMNELRLHISSLRQAIQQSQGSREGSAASSAHNTPPAPQAPPTPSPAVVEEERPSAREESVRASGRGMELVREVSGGRGIARDTTASDSDDADVVELDSTPHVPQPKSRVEQAIEAGSLSRIAVMQRERAALIATGLYDESGSPQRRCGALTCDRCCYSRTGSRHVVGGGAGEVAPRGNVAMNACVFVCVVSQ